MSMHGYINRNIVEIKVGGINILLKKVKKKLKLICMYIFLVLPCIPLVLIIRSISPLIIFRFGRLRGNRIGHLAGNTEIYLANKDSVVGNNFIDIFHVSKPICNHQLMLMWRRNLIISQLSLYIYLANKLIFGYKKHEVYISTDRDISNVLNTSIIHLKFSDMEVDYGMDQLRKYGLHKNSEYICFIGRDPAYLKKVYPDRDMSYHDYRDMDINAFKPAVKELCKKGYYLVRMGKEIQDYFNISDSKYIDYTTKYRSDFMDIYLCANCKFFISGNAGLDAVPMTLFRRPTVIVNMVPVSLIRSWDKNAIYIFKKHWLLKEKRFMRFSEIIKSEVGTYSTSEQFKSAGIKLIENSHNEILEVAIEMEKRLSSHWKDNQEDEELQNKFKSIFKGNKYNNEVQCRVGSVFLRENYQLIA